MSLINRQAVHGLRRHLSGAAYLIIQPLLLNAISLPVTAYIIRSLGAKGYGAWTTATTLAATVAFLTNLGLRMHFVRRVAQDHEVASEALSEQLGIRVLLATTAAVICVAACALLHYPGVVLGCALVSAFSLILSTIQTAFADLLQAMSRLKAMATINLIAGLLLTGASAVVARCGGGPVDIALSYVIGPMVGVLLGAWYVRSRICPFTVRWNLSRFGQILWQSRVLGLQLFAGAVGNQAEALLVPKIAGLAPNGYFNSGTLLPTRLSVVSDGLSTAFYPVMARNYKLGPSHLIRSCLMYLGASVGMCIPVALLVLAVAGPLSHLLFRHNAEICRQVMEITIWVLPINAIAAVMGYTLNACYREKTELKAGLTSSICGVIIAVLLTAKFGLLGACWSLVCRNTVSVLVRIPPFANLMLSLRTLRPEDRAVPIEAEPVSAASTVESPV